MRILFVNINALHIIRAYQKYWLIVVNRTKIDCLSRGEISVLGIQQYSNNIPTITMNEEEI